MSSLYQMLFTSQAANDVDDVELYEILLSSALNNKANGITGMLIYRDRIFLEKLEGDKEAVLATFNRIRSDRRHSEMKMIFHGDIDSRSFTDYKMCFDSSFEKTVRESGYYMNLQETEKMLSEIENPTKCVKKMMEALC